MALSRFKLEVFQLGVHPLTYLMSKLCTVKGLREYTYAEGDDPAPHLFRNCSFQYDGQYYTKPDIGDFGQVLALLANIKRQDQGCDPWINKSDKVKFTAERMYNHFVHAYGYPRQYDDVMGIDYADELAGVMRVMYREFLKACELVRSNKLALTKAHIDTFLILEAANADDDPYEVLTAGEEYSFMNEDSVVRDEPIKEAYREGILDRDYVEFIRRVNNPNIRNLEDERSVVSVNSVLSHIGEEEVVNITSSNDTSSDSKDKSSTSSDEKVSISSESESVDKVDAIAIRKSLEDKGMFYEGVYAIEEVKNDHDYDTPTDSEDHVIDLKNYKPQKLPHVPQFTEIAKGLRNRVQIRVKNYIYKHSHTADYNQIKAVHGDKFHNHMDKYTYYTRDAEPDDQDDEYPIMITEDELMLMLARIDQGLEPSLWKNNGILKRSTSNPDISKNVHFNMTIRQHQITPEQSLSSDDHTDLDSIAICNPLDKIIKCESIKDTDDNYDGNRILMFDKDSDFSSVIDGKNVYDNELVNKELNKENLINKSINWGDSEYIPDDKGSSVSFNFNDDASLISE